MKKKGSLLVLCLVFLFLTDFAALMSGCSSDEGLPPLKVALLKVGKADAIILRCGDETVVIDTGEEEDGDEILRYLKNEGTSRIDVMIITHFDRDHVGGAKTLLRKMDTGRIILPDYENTEPEYLSFLEAMKEFGKQPERIRQNLDFDLGSLRLKVNPPSSYKIPEGEKDYDNNFSLFTVVTHGENKLLFTGDAEKKRIREWLSSGEAENCQFLKYPHHGIYNKAQRDLLKAVRPEYTVICCSKKHPADAETLALLREHHVQTWQTREGDVTVISDGKNFEIKQR